MTIRRIMSRASGAGLLALAVLVAAVVPRPSAVGAPASADAAASAPASTAASAPAPAQTECGGGRLKVPGGVTNPAPRGSVPVVLVHGIVSEAAMWSAPAADGNATIARAVGDHPAASVYAFDYGDASLEWVTEERIGPALAEAILCLRNETGNEVILAAHSMGGLAIQHALGQPEVNSAVADVTTIATPFEGSKILTLLNRTTAVDRVPQTNDLRVLAVWAAWQMLLHSCAQLTRQQREQGGTGCALAGVPKAPIGRALMEGSDEIAALPEWPASQRVFRVAGQMNVRPFRLPTPFQVGDVAVAQRSALSRRVPNTGTPLVRRCTATVLNILTAPCMHTELAKDRQVIDAVVAHILPVVDELADDVAGSDVWRGTTYGSHYRSTRLVSAGYSMRGSFWFTLDDGGRVDGHARVTYRPYFDVDGLNAALGYIKDLGRGVVGLVPFIPFSIDVAVDLGINDMLAVRGQYDEPMSTMEGPITGTLTDGELSIEWADAEQIELPITVYMDGVDGSEELTRDALATGSPWPESATMATQGDDFLRAVSVSGDSSSESGVDIASNTTWSVHQP